MESRYFTGASTVTIGGVTSPLEPFRDDDGPEHNPFTTPSQSALPSAVPSARASTTALHQQAAQHRYFHSRMVKKGEVEKPWLENKDPKQKWVTIIPMLGILVGLGIAGVLIWDGLSTVVNYKYCPVLLEDFSSGTLDPKVWTQEVEVGGFGNGQFDETTTNNENAFVQDGMLHIKPSLQDPSLITNNNVLNLLKTGACTSDTWSSCVAVTNTTNGTIINPAKSARINTKAGAFIKYGRVEVEARLPAGDWLWPAIWMMPVKDTYGAWPASGEIDLAESRGNNYTYPQSGNNVISSTLHWGPDTGNDGWWQNNNKRTALHTTYADGFHTFGVEWSPKYLFTFVDSRLMQVLYVDFNKPFWQKGMFPPSNYLNEPLIDPWSQTGHDSTPFDQDFYLILNVAVGSTNGWFQDGVAGKPWVDASPSAKLDFWNAKDQWYPTWEQNGEMTVKSVKIWQQSGYNGCNA